MKLTKGNGLIVTDFIKLQHAFSTRVGGFSRNEYSSLNLGLSTGDDPIIVEKNRNLFYDYFGSSKSSVVTVKQVHGADVVIADRASWFEQEADAIITDKKDLLLIINTADCLPILFHDPKNNVIAAAHAGWRGTVARIVSNVVRSMEDNFSSSASDIIAIIGPGIAGNCYQVDSATIEKFRIAKFPQDIYWPDANEHYYLDILKANEFVLQESGLLRENIHSLNLCTHCDSGLFYSHRRDGRARGSHWAGIKL